MTFLTRSSFPTVQPRIGRPSKAEPFRVRLADWLAEDPGTASVDLLRRAKEAGYDGAKSALYDLIRELRPSRPGRVLPFQPTPGQATQHDSANVLVRFSDGATRRVYFFATRLTWSRWTAVSIIPDERVDSLVAAMLQHFGELGGIPLLALFDQPRVVARTDCNPGTVTTWNAAVAAMALDLGLGIDVCWRHRDGPHGASDSVSSWVKGKFFKGRHFTDEADLDLQLGSWLEEYNALPLARGNGKSPAELLHDERERFRPLKRIVPITALSLGARG